MNTEENIIKLLKGLKEEGVPTDSFRTNAKIRIINTVTEKPRFVPRYFGYSFGAALATVVLSVGTVYAAQSSLPTSTLYPVKVLSERVALTLSPTESLKTTVASSIISRRITEIETVQKQGNEKVIEESIANFDEDVASLQKRKGVSKEVIVSEIAAHRSFINSLRKNRSEENKGDTSTKSEQTQENTETSTPATTPTVGSPEIKLPSVEGVTNDHRDD